MKFHVLFSMAAMLLTSHVYAGQTACVVTTSGNVAFSKSSEQPDREYATFEKADSNGVSFFLRAGHGVVRLEAWQNGKLQSSTFVQKGNKAPYGDALNLAVQTELGEAEAQCEGVNAAIVQ